MRWVLLLSLLLWGLALALFGPTSAQAQSAPTSSLSYKRLVIREARAVFGLTAPVALFAGQIEQESAWRPDVCSAYACGLTQFTPGTADDIDAKHKLGGPNRSNPTWAVRAQMHYMKDLYNAAQVKYHPEDDCQRWSFALSSYNGGYGWVRRDKRLCALAGECNYNRWFGHVEHHSARAGWAIRENRGYVRRILGRTQFNYTTWGSTVTCQATS